MSGVTKAIGGAVKSLVKGAGKVIGGIADVAKSFVTADAIRLAAIGAGIYFTGGAMGAWPLPSFLSGAPGATAGVSTTLSQTTGMAAGPSMWTQPATQAGLAAATKAPLIQTAMASPMTNAALGPIMSGHMGPTTLIGAGAPLAGAPVAPPTAPAVAPAPAAATTTAAIAAPKPPHPFWTHPATHMGVGLLGGYMQGKAHEELLKKRYQHERDLQRERIAARQIRYGGGAGTPSRLYRATIS